VGIFAIESDAVGGFRAMPAEAFFGDLGAIVDRPYLAVFATSASGYEVAEELALPPGAVVTRALFTVAGKAPALPTPVGGIAVVRAAAGAPASSSSELAIDFGVLRTVSGLGSPITISSIMAWRGTRFDLSVVSAVNSTSATFTEVQTERLLVNLASSVSPATFAAGATVSTSTPPADLELLVGGTRVWARPGPTPAGFSETVDVTAALQALLDATPPAADGDVHVPVTLRARVPGDLELSLAQPVLYLRTHTVAFPGPTARTFAEEGRAVVPLPLPDGADAWTIHRVLATVTATDDDPLRVLPPVGPERSAQAELVLDPDRRVVVHVPAERFARFEQLVGIRIAVAPAAGGVELTGAVLADAERAAPDDAPRPGEPVPNGTLTPVTLDASDELAFVTLELAQPLKLAAGAALWFSLAATRGSAVVALAADGAPSAAATLRRVMPNGAVRAPSSPVGVRTDLLQLRVAGAAPPLLPIDVVEVELEGGATVREEVAGPALAASGLVSLALGPPAPRAGLALQLTATTTTTVTIGPVIVVYAEPATGGSP
jgi:hypothetical protein